MNISLAFTRIFFMILSVFFMTTYTISLSTGTPAFNALLGVGLGLGFGTLLIGFDLLFKRFTLRSFNIAIIGLFLGYLMGQALVLIFNAILDISAMSFTLKPQILEIIKIALFLFGLYLGTLMTLRSADELYISIPFVKFSPQARRKKDLIVDQSALSDSRIIDLAISGLLDKHMIIPQFVLKELYAQAETGPEASKEKAKRILEAFERLKELPELELRFSDTDFPEIVDPTSKLLRLARLLDANILTADITRVQVPSVEGIKVINLHSLSNALKPLTQTGEMIKIKIQRFGKEPKQGVGYLDDGTMVVVNGGGDYIGEVINVHVLSVKHTASGRMIFCNASEGEGEYQEEYHE